MVFDAGCNLHFFTSHKVSIADYIPEDNPSLQFSIVFFPQSLKAINRLWIIKLGVFLFYILIIYQFIFV